MIFNEKSMWSSGNRAPVPRDTPRALASCERHEELATIVQRYSWMYYHFLEESLPRLSLMLPYIGPKTKVLTWGKKYEVEWLKLLNITEDRIVRFDPEKVYCADRLLFATPTPKIEPPREALMALRAAVKADPPLPASARDLIVVVSRSDQETRRLSNEQQMIEGLKAAFPTERILVVKQTDTPAGLHTLELFKRAKIIIGPHGAGLSNMVFAAPETTIIEIAFLHALPLMFWHTAAALNQVRVLRYLCVPFFKAFLSPNRFHFDVPRDCDLILTHTNANTELLHGSCLRLLLDDPLHGSLRAGRDRHRQDRQSWRRAPPRFRHHGRPPHHMRPRIHVEC